MEMKIKYPGLDQTLLYLKYQAIESIPFAESFIPDHVNTPSRLFDFLRKNVIYFNDPFRIELLQSMQTLFSEKNQHRIYGAGDCDCFTIAALASLHVIGEKNIGIVLAGRKQGYPVHVYAYVDQIPFDLTNSTFGSERPYPHIQYLPVDMNDSLAGLVKKIDNF